ncbi:pantoate--beta-alanine ligase [Pseudomethylobacillus aquaticus]|uniref:Pantothenate synthetase n=1 Tax=Pseudomethylobacillus aquaticus TaxID=2676064 RepID=A0A3N0UVI9_9PROT|nr:pantoate--beta-alanine ligase [Pseudomethylobacillus aquaticus]ROH84522.1 pantoate--beta-alanine ligase [Pseudomethylobacillus aquaticus]
MHIVHTIAALWQVLETAESIALVPTMGNLHDGHLKLVETAREYADCVVVSIYVNPLQFGVNEDLARYPRTLEQDCQKLREAGASVVFAPLDSEMYPSPQTMTLQPGPVADILCGASRPGHFSGVATVVLKLFNLVQPDVAVFGKKDYQQLLVIRQLVQQFNLPIQIVGVDTVRTATGLAMSSRNGYLSAAQLEAARQLYAALQQLVRSVHAGEQDVALAQQAALQSLSTQGWQMDYVEVRRQQDLGVISAEDRALVVLAAGKLGSTRLIDNIEFELA